LKADYKERVFLAATGRRDYASTLPTANAVNYFSSNAAFLFFMI
jgi:hypothetical protein